MLSISTLLIVALLGLHCCSKPESCTAIYSQDEQAREIELKHAAHAQLGASLQEEYI
jgi:hypothetical protein